MGHEPSAGESSAACQDESWARFVRQTRSETRLPFDQHWTRFQEIFRARRAMEGPPMVWQPDAEQIAASNLGRWMKQRGQTDYARFHRWSVAERSEFWGDVIERLGVVLVDPPETVLDLGAGVEKAHWLPGATLNCVDSCFTSAADAPAIVSGREGSSALEVTTYGQLERLVNRVARGLVERGLSAGDRIALYMPMTVECVAAYLGIIRAGGTVVSIADSFSVTELSKRLEISAATGIVTVESYQRAGKIISLFEKVIAAGAPRAIVVPADASGRSGMCTGVVASAEAHEVASLRARLRPDDCSWHDLLLADNTFESITGDPDGVINVLFSSGTTGIPKAIPWTHLTPIKCAMDGRFHQDIRAGDVVSWPTNIGWMMGPWLVFATFMNGATMALFEGAPLGAEFTQFIRTARVSMLGVVPSLVRAWRSRAAVPAGAWNGVRVFSSTGEPSNVEDYLWLMSRADYRAPIIEYLGGTEIGGGHLTGTVVQPASPATFTTAALGVDVVLLDENDAIADEGDLYLVPPAIGLSQVLLNGDHHAVYHAGCPVGPHGEVLRRHGDRIERLCGGFFRARGRADDTMNLGGIKVSSVEIETVIDGHEAVRECAAVAVQPSGEGAEKLVLFVVLASPVETSRLAPELGQLLATKLNPLFKIHDIVPTETLPRTASNKVMRRQLRASYTPRNPRS